MKYQVLFAKKTMKKYLGLSSAAVVLCALGFEPLQGHYIAYHRYCNYPK